jgi:hypothetical protein
MLLAFALYAGPASASDDCETIGIDGLPRDCTYTEEVGKCFYTALVSYTQCKEEAEWYERWYCIVALDIDVAACGLEAIKELILD